MEKLPSIRTPPATPNTPGLHDFLSDVKTNLENIASQVSAGGLTEAEVTALIFAALSQFQATGVQGATGAQGAPGAGIPPTSTTPVEIPDLQVTASRTFALLQWGAIPYPDHAFTTIYRNTVDNVLTATAIGTSNVLVYQDYTVADGNWYYWIAGTSKGSVATPDGIEGPKSSSSTHVVIDSLINNTNIHEFFTTGAIGTDYLIASKLAAITATLGDVTAGTLKSIDGYFNIDLVQKQIVISNGDIASNDYIIIENGRIQQFKWTGATHQPGQALTTTEAGQVANGQTVILQRYYESQPYVIVTPFDTPVYDANNNTSNQSLQVRAENLIELIPGSGTWQFDAIARSVISATSSTTVLNVSQGPASTSPFATGIFPLPANTEDFTVNMSFLSVRGTGISNEYHYRQVTWNIFYREVGTTPWTAEIPVIAAIGNTITTFINSNSTVTGLPAPSTTLYEFYVEATYADTGAKFSLGSAFEFATDYVLLPSDVTTTDGSRAGAADYQYEINFQTYNKPTSLNFGSYSLPADWQYDGNVVYKLQYGYFVKAQKNSQANTITAQVAAGPHSVTAGDFSIVEVSSGAPGLNNTITQGDIARGSYQQTLSTGDGIYSITGTATITTNPFKLTRVFGSIRYKRPTNGSPSSQPTNGCYAIIKRKKNVGGSTVAQNTQNIISYNYTTIGTSVLNPGTLEYHSIL